MRKIYSTLFITFLFPFLSVSQNAKDFIVSGKGTTINFSNFAPKTAAGIDFEFFILKRFSVRGGYIQSPDFIKVTPGSVFWGLTSLAMNGRGGGSFGGGCFGSGPRMLVALFGLTDGFAYYIPVSKNIYITPYIAPMQWVLLRPNSKSNYTSTLLSAAGVGIRYFSDDHLSFDVSAEFNRATFFAQSKRGFSVNFSVGYKFSNPMKDRTDIISQ